MDSVTFREGLCSLCRGCLLARYALSVSSTEILQGLRSDAGRSKRPRRPLRRARLWLHRQYGRVSTELPISSGIPLLHQALQAECLLLPRLDSYIAFLQVPQVVDCFILAAPVANVRDFPRVNCVVELAMSAHLLRPEQHWCGQSARASSRNRGCRHSTGHPEL